MSNPTTIPSLDEVRARLASLTIRQLERLEQLSGVSRHTMYKIRSGETIEPGYAKVGEFWAHIEAAKKEPK